MLSSSKQVLKEFNYNMKEGKITDEMKAQKKKSMKKTTPKNVNAQFSWNWNIINFI